MDKSISFFGQFLLGQLISFLPDTLGGRLTRPEKVLRFID